MSLYLPPELKEKGKAEFEQAVGRGLTRRDFMKGLAAAGAALPLTAAMYYGYTKLHGDPIKVGLIGAGDEGGVLVGEHNPEYLEFVAYSDIRPSNQKRIFEGEPTGPRKGFNKIYGEKAKKIQFHRDYHDLLERKDIDAVVIALPLHLHAPVAIDALKKGKHVLCEKLMAWNVQQCKKMIQAAEKYDRILAIGHQRHYSMLYAHALEVVKSGDLGDIKHIRALWHRNNAWPLLDEKGNPKLDAQGRPRFRDGWQPDIKDEDRLSPEDLLKFGKFKSMEELVRWRLYNETGGGLMAELGSHQLDACSIFLGKVHPLAVTGVGGKYFYHDDRQIEDHVFVTFEFPGRNYYQGEEGEALRVKQERGEIKDQHDKVIVTYSSISTNTLEPYGECVMGSRASLLVENEATVMLIPERNPNAALLSAKPTTLSVTTTGAGKPAIDSSASTGALSPADAQAKGQQSLGTGPVSRGYREEMEHFAYCVKMWNQGASKTDRPIPRCDGQAAMADAIIALTANLAMRNQKRYTFDPQWFDYKKTDLVPDMETTPRYVIEEI